MSCNIETYAVPSWWGSATTVQLTLFPSGGTSAYDVADVEILPHGVSNNDLGIFFPWSVIRTLEKVS